MYLYDVPEKSSKVTPRTAKEFSLARCFRARGKRTYYWCHTRSSRYPRLILAFWRYWRTLSRFYGRWTCSGCTCYCYVQVSDTSRCVQHTRSEHPQAAERVDNHESSFRGSTSGSRTSSAITNMMKAYTHNTTKFSGGLRTTLRRRSRFSTSAANNSASRTRKTRVHSH